jgi:hypothetical protein
MRKFCATSLAISAVELAYALAVAMVCGGWPWSLIPFAGAAVTRAIKKCVAILSA